MLGILARFKAYIFCRSEQGLNVTQTHQKELQIAEEKRKKQCASSEKEMRAEQRRTAKAVKRQLRRERQRNKRMLKVVMLGTCPCLLATSSLSFSDSTYILYWITFKIFATFPILWAALVARFPLTLIEHLGFFLR
jgi:cation transport ATPase